MYSGADCNVTDIGVVTPAGHAPLTEVVRNHIVGCCTFNISVYGFAGLFTVPSTVEKLSYEYSNFVIEPPFPDVVKTTASFTVVDVLLAVRVPAVVGVVQGATQVLYIVNVPTLEAVPPELQ